MSSPMNFDLALLAVRVGLFLIFVYEGWTKLADLKDQEDARRPSVDLCYGGLESSLAHLVS